MDINQKIQNRYGAASKFGKSIEGNKTLSDILTRRSHRKFKSDPVAQDLLDTLFATAFSAPSKSDLQQACVILLEDEARQKRIANLFPQQHWLAQAPVFMVWCGDSRRIRRLAEWRNHPFANDHLDAFMNAAVDAGITMQTFITAAESVGLGCCPVSEVRDHIDALSAELSLPQYVFPVAGLCLGWPQELPDISMRLPLEVSVKVNRYNDDNLIEQVSDYDQRREKLENTPPEQQRLVDELGVSTNYGWSENRTRQYSRSARADFGQYIRRQGFDLS
jgi:nitroreductase